MTDTNRRRYVVHHDGQFLYYLDRADFDGRDGKIEQLDLYADDTPMTRLDAKNYRGGWFAADHRARQILVQDPPKRIPTGYTLTDPAMESAKYPAALTVEQWQALGVDENRWQYGAEHREEPAELVALATDAGDWAQIEGMAPPETTEDTPAWAPDLMPGLMERREFHHLMPGRIPGLREHVYKRLERMVGMFRVTRDPSGKASGIYVRLQVPFEREVTHWKADIGRSGKELKSGKTVQTTVTRELRLPVPLDVPGENYAQALAAWDEGVEFWLGVVCASSAGAAKACNHCGGHGFVGGDVFTEYDVQKEVL
jgi:hypothetical protein